MVQRVVPALAPTATSACHPPTRPRSRLCRALPRLVSALTNVRPYGRPARWVGAPFSAGPIGKPIGAGAAHATSRNSSMVAG
jgi:hypothetical protein